MTSKQAIELFKKKYPNKKPIGFWIDRTNVIINTAPSFGHGYSEVCQYIVFDNGEIQATNPMHSEVIINTPMKRIK